MDAIACNVKFRSQLFLFVTILLQSDLAPADSLVLLAYTTLCGPPLCGICLGCLLKDASGLMKECFG